MFVPYPFVNITSCRKPCKVARICDKSKFIYKFIFSLGQFYIMFLFSFYILFTFHALMHSCYDLTRVVLQTPLLHSLCFNWINTLLSAILTWLLVTTRPNHEILWNLWWRICGAFPNWKLPFLHSYIKHLATNGYMMKPGVQNY